MNAKTVRLLEENIGEKLHDVGFGNDFGCSTKNTRNTIENGQFGLCQNLVLEMLLSDKTLTICKPLDLIPINLSVSEVSGNSENATWSGKTLANHESDKGLISRILYIVGENRK